MVWTPGLDPGSTTDEEAALILELRPHEQACAASLRSWRPEVRVTNLPANV